MRNLGILPLLLVVAIALAVLYIYRRREQAMAAAGTQENILVRGVNTVTSKSGSYLGKVPVVGGLVDKVINQPARNVTSGNWTEALSSAATGGFSDVFDFDPVGWI
jgi:hypothetical protein